MRLRFPLIRQLGIVGKAIPQLLDRRRLQVGPWRTRQVLIPRYLPLLITVLTFVSTVTVADRSLYNESFRPQFHFTPLKNWMNDPNGLVYYKGKYHLFFQYNPFGNEWGHMSWGHAVSLDLVHWKQLPVAIPEQNGVMIFSGSAVTDWQNTSSFCKSPTNSDGSCLIAIYTGYNGKIQDQNIAYSNDRGRAWTKYSHNPVINLNLSDFRDPKVFWYRAGHKWVMVTALSTEHKVQLFGSTDLRHWTPLSTFGPAGIAAGAWECPDLFELPVENQPGQSRWVLSINVNPGGVAGGSGDQYFVGWFDGWKFVSENPRAEVLWADYGKDFYASTTFSDIPPSDGRRIWMGWLDNWEYAGHLPTAPWHGQQSIPRILKLRRFAQGIRLVQEPIAELSRLRQQHIAIADQSIPASNRTLQSQKVAGDALEIEAIIDGGQAESFGLEVRKGASEATQIGVDRLRSELFVDRTHSGDTSFAPSFRGRQSAPLNLLHRTAVELHIFVDRCSVEVFANHGERVISDLIFPALTSQGLELYSHGGDAKIVKLDIWKLRSAWGE
jgi:fructan beta-fructosidase